MSFHRENAIWQSPDGTWSRGMYPVGYYECGQDDDCENAPEHEWCAEFDQSAFEWVSSGHPNEEAAEASWRQANPGGHNSYPYDPANPGANDKFEDMAAVLYEEAQKSRAEDGSDFGYGYRGPARQRTLKALTRQRNELEAESQRHLLGGYANLPDERLPGLNKQIDDRLATATPADKSLYLVLQTARRDGMEKMLTDHRARRAEQERVRSRFSYGGYDPDASRRRLARQVAEKAVEKHIEELDAAITRQRDEFSRASDAKKAPAPGKPSPAKRSPGRVSKGVPTGGQFSASQRAEADVALPPALVDPTDPWGTL